MAQEYEHCDICPHLCGVDRTRGEFGFCGASADMLVARADLHFWEEPTVSGCAGSGTVFFSHCNMRCLYCQNAEISRGGRGKPKTPAEVAKICIDLQRRGAMNVNFVTPTHYSPGVREAVAIAKGLGLDIPVVWNTGGYESAATIRENVGAADVYLTDFKYLSDEHAGMWSCAHDYPQVAICAIDEMVRCTGDVAFDVFDGVERIVKGVIVRHLMLPGCLSESLEIVRLLHQRYGTSIRLSLMSQYTPVLGRGCKALEMYPAFGRRVENSEYERLLDFADSIGVDDYYWQDGNTADESFIPSFGEDGT